jgi:hypothetical protein
LPLWYLRALSPSICEWNNYLLNRMLYFSALCKL